jgi:uncharacterized protein
MTRAFADTSFYVAAVNPRDALHARANEQAKRLRETIITTEYVLIETANWLARSGDRQVFLELMKRIQADRRTIVVPSNSDLFERGLDLYTRRPDKDWSLTDCISFVVMRERGLNDALTADHHFEQAGFTVLLK